MTRFKNQFTISLQLVHNLIKGEIQMETFINIVIGVVVGTLLSWVLTTLGILAIAWCDDK